VLVSCRLSSTGVGFLSILFPPEGSALLTVGLPDRRPSGPDSVGVSVFRTRETRPGWVPSLLRGGGVLPTSAASLVGACRFPAASPIPRWNVPSAELLITEHAKIHSRSPVRPSPRPPPPDGTRAASAFPLGFAPRGYPRTPGWGRSRGHWTGSHPHQSTSNRRDHSLRATSRRTATPSFLDALAALRRVLWSQRITALSAPQAQNAKITDVLLDTLAYAA